MKERNIMLKESKVAVRVLSTGLLALMPAVLNSSTPVKDMPMNAQELTEVVAQIPSEDVATIDFREVQETQQNYPLGWAYFENRTIKEIVPATGGGRAANLVLTGNSTSNDVFKVYYVDSEKKDDNRYHHPPVVLRLIYHNLGEGKEFLGIRTRQYLYHDKKDPEAITGTLYREIRLDDRAAQYLIDLRTGDTKWNNKTDISFEVTNSPRVMIPEVH